MSLNRRAFAEQMKKAEVLSLGTDQLNTYLEDGLSQAGDKNGSLVSQTSNPKESSIPPFAAELTRDYGSDPSDIEITPPEDPSEQKPIEFPLHAFPKLAQQVIEEICEALLVPPQLVGCAVLGVLSAAVGAGIRVQSSPSRFTRGNLYILAVAESGTGKDAAQEVLKTLCSVEEEITSTWKRDTLPSIEAESDLLATGYKRLKEKAAKCEDPEQKEAYLQQMIVARARMEELSEKKIGPALSVADITKEALGVKMSAQAGEALASIAIEGRGVIDVLCGRYNDGSSDEDFYTAAFSGNSIKVDRISRASVWLRSPCLSIFWMIQPDKLWAILKKAIITESGLLQRFLPCNTHAEPQEIPEQQVAINLKLIEQWDQRIRSLIYHYRLRQEPVTILPSLEAVEMFRQFNNELVRKRRTGGELHDVNSYVARWAEQAWRIAVPYHSFESASDAHHIVLTPETANNVITITSWFNQEQLAILEAGRSQQRLERFTELEAVLERLPEGRCTLRDLGRRHNFGEVEVTTFAKEYHHRLEILTPVSGSKGGRPSRVAALKKAQKW